MNYNNFSIFGVLFMVIVFLFKAVAFIAVTFIEAIAMPFQIMAIDDGARSLFDHFKSY